jgi:HemX protein
MTSEIALLTVATVLYLGGFGHAFTALRQGVYRPSWPALALMAGGFLCQSLFLLWRGEALRRCPITNPLELMTFTAWAMVLFYFVVGSAYRLSLLGAFTAPLAFVMQLSALLKPDTAPVPLSAPPGLWTELHVTVSLLAYGAYALACVAGVMFLLQDRLLKKHTGLRLMLRLPPVHHLTKATRGLLMTGTVLLTAGILSAYQMEVLPGAPKLVVVWTVWGAYVLLGLYESWRGMSARRAAWAATGCFALAVASLWFVTPR